MIWAEKMGSGYGTSGTGNTPVTTIPPYTPPPSSTPTTTSSGYSTSKSSATPSVIYPASTGNGYGTSGKGAVNTLPTSTGAGYGSTGGGSSIERNIIEVDSVTRQQIERSSRIERIESVYQIQANPAIGDVVTGFNPKKDVLAFSIDDLPPGFVKPRLKIVKNEAQLEKALKATSNCFIYDLSTGHLILDANGRSPGFGDDGGIVAIIAGGTRITRDNIAFYSE